MTKTLKQLVRVLWAIEKDLHVIASNMEAIKNKKALFSAVNGTPNALEIKTSLSHNLPKEFEKDRD
ncbi:hypothetical protein [Lactiplantibacillus mudanjiangensis]|uniref:Uncharacterized protein n=1 Tax=Lactiplantibacillus mudanjiangensis TaxID=1296538 RepID=A0A660EAE4_9LACO|nr:hypothetical protein [Lactiplantibacillus mudanjiangensis]VDG18581.1 hypothetical protein [Lactobacillus plantarum] [Lactiplantibacillus mudanjiangensis]VDG24199.1 hypothetical protein [Lactobacillus plantarum] [Lactiplantibacillus mudanjiangensis]VDG30177.1 hypothetical protein [Lactobacillus plantarum] [Lactiplantibacillus mudanjiangensis]